MNVGYRLTTGRGSSTVAVRGFLFARYSTTKRSAPESVLSSHVEEDGFPRMVDVGEKVREGYRACGVTITSAIHCDWCFKCIAARKNGFRHVDGKG